MKPLFDRYVMMYEYDVDGDYYVQYQYEYNISFTTNCVFSLATTRERGFSFSYCVFLEIL